MGAHCRQKRGSAKVVVSGPSSAKAEPMKFDGRANLGAQEIKAVSKRPTAGTGKPNQATRLS